MNKQQSRQSVLTGQHVSLNSLLFFRVFLILGTLSFYYDALAYRGDSPKDPEQIIAELSEKLQLTDAQVGKTRPIIENQMEKRNEILKKYSSKDRSGKRAMREEMVALKNDTDSQIMSLLTEEQIVKYQVMQEEQYPKIREKRERSGKRGGGRIN